MDFCVYISLFLVVDNAITLFNYLFHDFRGFCDFRDFRGFDLALARVYLGLLCSLVSKEFCAMHYIKFLLPKTS